jgi:hypothetical protein
MKKIKIYFHESFNEFFIELIKENIGFDLIAKMAFFIRGNKQTH